MTWKEINKKIHDRFDKKIVKWFEHNEHRIYVDIDPADLVEFGRFLFEDLQARFIIASGVDTPRDGIEILYHFDFFQLPYVFSVRVFIEKPKLEVDSLVPYIKGAEWIEREISELLGIQFNNHPDMRHLILPDDWPEGKYPLRRDQ
ncbi:NADH-quinone oxidoreductase subunit C [bacterium]|nr:NADH-quinone oxidoreductase subunit C [bacterium]